MSANPKSDSLYMTEAEYLEFERNSDIKHEYIQGQAVAMAGAKPNHNRLTTKLLRLIDTHFDDKDCEVFGGDQRVKIEKAKEQYYPDLSVVCGKPQFTDEPLPALLNPILIIEVLSPSAEKFDQGGKFRQYRQLESLQEYVLISQEAVQIECYYLNERKKWELTDVIGLDASMTLESIDCTLSLADIYQNVQFEDEGSNSK